jgi:hypothetical protein
MYGYCQPSDAESTLEEKKEQRVFPERMFVKRKRRIPLKHNVDTTRQKRLMKGSNIQPAATGPYMISF